jgi:excisionase family DNA binding protein
MTGNGGQIDEALITIIEAAQRLGCHPESIRRQIRAGRIASIKRGPNGRHLVSVEEVDRLVPRAPGRPRHVPEEEAWNLLLRLLGLEIQLGRPDDDPSIDSDLEDPGFRSEALDPQGLYEEDRQVLVETMLRPNFDPPLYKYLHFHRLQVEGSSWREAASQLGISTATAQSWMKLDRFIPTLRGRVLARRRRLAQGLHDPQPSRIARRRGPKPHGRPDLSEADEAHSIRLLQEKVADAEALGALDLARAQAISLPLVANVHRYALLGLGTAQISLLVGRTRRRVQQLRATDPVPALQVALRRSSASDARDAYLEARRQESRGIRAWRGFDEPTIPE